MNEAKLKAEIRAEIAALKAEILELYETIDTLRHAASRRLGCPVCKMNEAPFLSKKSTPLDFSRIYS